MLLPSFGAVVDPNRPPAGCANEVVEDPNKPAAGCVVTAGAPNSPPGAAGCPNAGVDPNKEGVVVTAEPIDPNGAAADVVAPKENP